MEIIIHCLTNHLPVDPKLLSLIICIQEASNTVAKFEKSEHVWIWLVFMMIFVAVNCHSVSNVKHQMYEGCNGFFFHKKKVFDF